jgi:hypothetical protein
MSFNEEIKQMAGYGVHGYVTLLGDTVEDIERQVKLYEKEKFFEQGPICSTDKAPRWRRHGKYMCIVSFMNTSDTE